MLRQAGGEMPDLPGHSLQSPAGVASKLRSPVVARPTKPQDWLPPQNRHRRSAVCPRASLHAVCRTDRRAGRPRSGTKSNLVAARPGSDGRFRGTRPTPPGSERSIEGGQKHAKIVFSVDFLVFCWDLFSGWRSFCASCGGVWTGKSPDRRAGTARCQTALQPSEPVAIVSTGISTWSDQVAS